MSFSLIEWNDPKFMNMEEKHASYLNLPLLTCFNFTLPTLQIYIVLHFQTEIVQISSSQVKINEDVLTHIRISSKK